MPWCPFYRVNPWDFDVVRGPWKSRQDAMAHFVNYCLWVRMLLYGGLVAFAALEPDVAPAVFVFTSGATLLWLLAKAVAAEPEKVWWRRWYLALEAVAVLAIAIAYWCDGSKTALPVGIIYGVHWLCAVAVGWQWTHRH